MGKNFSSKEKRPVCGRRKLQTNCALRITNYALKKISFLSLAGQTAIVNQAILLASGRRYLRLLRLSSNDIFAESLAVTVTGSLRLNTEFLIKACAT